VVCRELSVGGAIDGIAFQWDKCSVFATNWAAFAATPAGVAAGLTSAGITVAGYNIWTGTSTPDLIPLINEFTIEKLLGKNGCVADHHSQAAIDTLAKLEGVRSLALIKRSSWDEAAMLIQLIARGYLAYCPLLGIPSPAQLHAADASMLRVLISSLGARSTVERVSLFASASIGGLQVCSMVESTVASVLRDLLYILNGVTTASTLARDSLHECLHLPPRAAIGWTGLVPKALRFLAGYGIYVAVSPDRLVNRILSALSALSPLPVQLMVGPFVPANFANGQVSVPLWARC